MYLQEPPRGDGASSSVIFLPKGSTVRGAVGGGGRFKKEKMVWQRRAVQMKPERDQQGREVLVKLLNYATFSIE